jgi:orotate phosphoribosyltransferase-like protein
LKGIVFNSESDPFHQVQEIVNIVKSDQTDTKDLTDIEEMTDISLGEITAAIAVTGFIDGCEVLGVTPRLDRNGFAVADKSKIKNKSILLIDDVKTTGATLNNCAKALKRAGATRVVCVTLASTPEQFVYE